MASTKAVTGSARPQRLRFTSQGIGPAVAWLAPRAPALLLALLAAGVPLFVWARLEDQVVIPRLFATGLLTGLALGVLALAPLPAIAWRRVGLPLALLAALIAIAALTTATGVDTGNSLFGEAHRYQGLLPLLMYALLFVAAMLAVARAGSPQLLIVGVFAGGTLAGGYAVLQKLGLDWVDWSGVPEGRIGGAFAQPNALGVELVTAGFASLALWRDATARQRAAIATGCALMLLGLLFTLSRGAWVGAVAGAFVLGALWLLARTDGQFDTVDSAARPSWVAWAPSPRIAGIALVVALLTLVIGGATALVPAGRHAYARAFSVNDRGAASISAHTGLWRTSLGMIRDRPLLGGGPESFSTLFASYRTPDQPGIGTANVRPESAHNFFLDQAVGLGIPGVAIFIAFIASALIVGWQPSYPGQRRRAYGAPLIAAVSAYYAAVCFSFADAMTGWLPWLLMGALIGGANRVRAAEAGSRTSLMRSDDLRRAALAAVALLLLLASGAMLLADYQAGQAQRAAAARHGDDAIAHARRASSLNPLDRQYLYDLASYEERAGVAGDRSALADAFETYRTVDTRFAATAFGVISEARVMTRMWQIRTPGVQVDEINARLEAAAHLDPYNTDIRHAIAKTYADLGERERAVPYLAP